jgi:GH24 family phage-related lysozyme (muramidase)
MFNLGYVKFAQFHNTVAAINRGDWSAAQEGLHQSKWYVQVGSRADRIIAQLEIE